MVIVFGGLLLIGGVVVAMVFGDQAAGGWLLPIGLGLAGLGVVLAGVVAKLRRQRVLRAVMQARKAVAGKSGKTERAETALGGPVSRVKALPAMIAATARGKNPAMPRYQLGLWLLALIYLAWPLDVIPDILPLVGIGDDIGVGTWLLTSLYAESGNFVATREQQPDPEPE